MMIKQRSALAAAILISLINGSSGFAQPTAKPDSNRPFGLEKRIPWSTSRFRGSPDPSPPYRAERVFPKLHFRNPTVLTNAPGTDRLFVAEQYGKIFSIPNDPG